LGLACLLSYAYRFRHFGERDGNLGPHWGTIFFTFLHLSLNLSSFQFQIPARRIKSGFRIWPEYRIHSLVFCARSLALILLHCWEQKMNNSTGERYRYYSINLLIVLAACAAADYGSHLQRQHQSPTIRGLQFSPAFKYVFSVLQFQATAHCLVGARRHTSQVVFAAIIQINAFLMTLQRKNVASPRFMICLYGLLLAMGGIVGHYDDFYYAHTVLVSQTFGNVAALFRMGPLHVNKYLLWTVLGIVSWILRHGEIIQLTNNDFWFHTNWSTMACVFGLYHYKRQHGTNP
jgi:hypothetical protein